MNSEVKVSVIVPTWNRPEPLRKALEGLAAQNDAPPFEVLVIENGSTVTDSLGPVFPRFRFLRRVERGVCAARNMGLREARGELLIFLDDDVVPIPQFVAVHVAAHHGSAGRVVIGHTEFIPDENSVSYSARRQTAEASQWAQQLLRRPETRCAPSDFSTGNFSLRRDLLLAVEGFDESFDPYGVEELDLALRLEAKAAEFVFHAQAAGLHVGADSEAAFYEKARLSGRGFARLLQKHGLNIPDAERALVVKGYTTWRGVCFRWAFQHIRWLVRAVRGVVAALTWISPLGQTRLVALDYRIKLHYAFWSGVREIIGWRDLEQLLQERSQLVAHHATRT